MIKEEEICYKIALSMTPGVTADVVRRLEQCGICYSDFFKLNMSELSSALGEGKRFKFQNADREEALFRAKKELSFVEKHSIEALFLLDENYPVLLKEAPDAPVILYKYGKADLNSHPALNIVGTRRCTSYGTNFCKSFVSDLAAYYPNAMIVSGLAYGIDAAGHEASLDNNIITVAVVAHGLDTIYPAAHRDLAKRIIASGGAILSEYPSGVRPFKKNFLERNRIVAGLCELTFVVESEIKGGAMSTANMAFSYGREVIALPGRYSDSISQGCNSLIEKNKAHIYTSIANLMNLMQWRIHLLGTLPPKKTLFPELEGDHNIIYRCIEAKSEPISIDEIHISTGLPMPTIMSGLGDLEFEGIIMRLPGARYEKC